MSKILHVQNFLSKTISKLSRQPVSKGSTFFHVQNHIMKNSNISRHLHVENFRMPKFGFLETIRAQPGLSLAGFAYIPKQPQPVARPTMHSAGRALREANAPAGRALHEGPKGPHDEFEPRHVSRRCSHFSLFDTSHLFSCVFSSNVYTLNANAGARRAQRTSQL